MSVAKTTLQEREWEIVHHAVARLRARVMAATFAMVGGGALFSATVWLLLKGGPNVGEHLGLLRHYFPGYSVSWPGAVTGLFWGALVGGVLGWSLAWIYNRIADRRRPV